MTTRKVEFVFDERSLVTQEEIDMLLFRVDDPDWDVSQRGDVWELLPRLIGLAQSCANALRPPAPAATVTGWRPEVAAFADAMENKLRANDHKGGWKNDINLDLYYRMEEESRELLTAVATGRVDEILGEAADVANFAMMVADVCGVLDIRRRLTPPEITDAMRAVVEEAEIIIAWATPTEWVNDSVYINIPKSKLIALRSAVAAVRGAGGEGRE